jgi:hypothetical protein
VTVILWEHCTHVTRHVVDLTWEGAAVLLAFFGLGWVSGRASRKNHVFKG